MRRVVGNGDRYAVFVPAGRGCQAVAYALGSPSLTALIGSRAWWPGHARRSLAAGEVGRVPVDHVADRIDELGSGGFREG